MLTSWRLAHGARKIKIKNLIQGVQEETDLRWGTGKCNENLWNMYPSPNIMCRIGWRLYIPLENGLETLCGKLCLHETPAVFRVILVSQLFWQILWQIRLGESAASEFYMPTFRNTVVHLHGWRKHHLWRLNKQIIPKRRHIKFRRRGFTQRKEYDSQITAEVWNKKSKCGGKWTARCCFEFLYLQPVELVVPP
jgi:hypothetical protein